jgi:hypothetical protein
VLFLFNYDFLPYAVFYDSEDGEMLRDWVEEGNTLIVAGSSFHINSMVEAFGVTVGFCEPGVVDGRNLPRDMEITWSQFLPAAPTLLSPPVDHVQSITQFPMCSERDDVVPHIIRGGLPILVSFPRGQGMVWVSGMVNPFTNEGLGKADNGALIANMLAHVPSGATIGFDERGQGLAENVSTFNDWLFGTAPGWSVVLGVVMTMVYLFLRGRRFGQAIPLPENRLRREPVEYIQAMATLFRRTGQREAMMRHYDGQLRRRLSERYGVDPKLRGDELVKRVVYADPSVDEAVLRELLMRLSRADVSEHELIAVAEAADEYMKTMN